MRSCTTRLRSAANGAPVPRNPLIGNCNNTITHLLHPRPRLLVTCKLLCPDVVLIHIKFNERSVCCRNHGWRASNIKDRVPERVDMSGKHFRIDVADRALPSAVAGVDTGESRDETEVLI